MLCGSAGAQFSQPSRLLSLLGPIPAWGSGQLLLAASPRWFVLEVLPGFLACVPPVDLGPFLVGLVVPGLGFPLQLSQVWNPPRAQALV